MFRHHCISIHFTGGQAEAQGGCVGGEECCLPVVESVGIQEGSHVWQALQRQLLELLLPTYSYLRKGGLRILSQGLEDGYNANRRLKTARGEVYTQEGALKGGPREKGREIPGQG